MSWWNSVASLTPIVAHDVLGYAGGTTLPDRVGSNTLDIRTASPLDDFKYKGAYGSSKMWNYASAVSAPTQGVWAMLFKPVDNTILFSSGTSNYTIYCSSTNIWYSSYGTFAAHGTLSVFGNWTFVALVKGATTSQLYVNGSPVGTGVANSVVPPTSSTMIGYVTDGTGAYDLSSSEQFAAGGVWSGTPSLADIQALETAMRAALVGSVSTLFAKPLPLSNLRSTITAPIAASARIAFLANYDQFTKRNSDIGAGGRGRIVGTTKNKADPTDLPVSRKVRLHDEATGKLVAETWSVNGTGAYSFNYIDPSRVYTVLSYDHTGVFRAVIADGQIPEIM